MRTVAFHHVAPLRPTPIRSAGRAGGRRGQATTEWMLLGSVLAIAIVGVGWGLAQTFSSDMDALGHRAGTVYNSGDLAR